MNEMMAGRWSRRSTNTLPRAAAGAAAPRGADELLAEMAVPCDHAEVLLASGRRVELEAAPEGDRLTVRAASGRALVRLRITEASAELELEGRELALRMPGKLTLAAEDIALEATRDLTLRAGRDVSERVAGSRHARIQGGDRLEAAQIELQANRADVRVRAMDNVAIDGARIGLNDEPCPAPFGWSAIAEGDGGEPDGREPR